MLTFDLSTSEQAILREVLEDAASEPGTEISGTDSKDFRDDLMDRHDVPQKVSAALEGRARRDGMSEPALDTLAAPPPRNGAVAAGPAILRDPRLRAVAWKDLTTLRRREIAKELTLSLPWLALSLYLASRGLYLLALPVSFFFFLAGLRQVHDAHHYNLGISRTATEGVMFALSALMLGSMHAVQFNHLRHHKHCMDEEDVEAISAQMPWWKALLWGPVFPILLHRTALRGASPHKLRWIHAELVANAVVLAAVVALPHAGPLRYHFLAMAAGHCMTAFFAVWTVHHDCDREHHIARTLRNPLKSAIALDMFFHVEHHLFPKVPTCHLPELARRLDRVAPELSEKQVY